MKSFVNVIVKLTELITFMPFVWQDRGLQWQSLHFSWPQWTKDHVAMFYFTLPLWRADRSGNHFAFLNHSGLWTTVAIVSLSSTTVWTADHGFMRITSEFPCILKTKQFSHIICTILLQCNILYIFLRSTERWSTKKRSVLTRSCTSF